MQATERRPRLLRTPSHDRVRLQNAAPDLIELDRFEQSLEVAFAEPFVALALDYLEENGSDHIAREDLQQHLLAGRVRIAVDQNAQAAQLLERLAVPRQARVDRLEVGVRRVLELYAARAQRGHRVIDVRGPQRDVLDALSVVLVQVLDDLAMVIRTLVDRNPDLAARAAHRLALQTGLPALDVEVAHFAEVEQALVELGPLLHPAAVHVVRQMVDLLQ